MASSGDGEARDRLHDERFTIRHLERTASVRHPRRRKLCPQLDQLEEKQLLNAALPAIHAASSGRASEREADYAAVRSDTRIAARGVSEFKILRITNTRFPSSVNLKPPFLQVLVQATQPVPGQVYNVLQLSMRNGTNQTFTASSGLSVRLATSGDAKPRAFPVLTGGEQWKPGQFATFYVLTKKYYPVNPVVSAGFSFSFAPGAVAIPGPSGIFLRLKYNPATFAKTLDWIVAYGPGAEGGKGAKLGLPDTAIWEFVSAKTNIEPL
jgi:hypothetical protein